MMGDRTAQNINLDLWRIIDDVLDQVPRDFHDIRWIRAHLDITEANAIQERGGFEAIDIIGNNGADEAAKMAMQCHTCDFDRFRMADDRAAIAVITQCMMVKVWSALTKEDPTFAKDAEDEDAAPAYASADEWPMELDGAHHSEVPPDYFNLGNEDDEQDPFAGAGMGRAEANDHEDTELPPPPPSPPEEDAAIQRPHHLHGWMRNTGTWAKVEQSITGSISNGQLARHLRENFTAYRWNADRYGGSKIVIKGDLTSLTLQRGVKQRVQGLGKVCTIVNFDPTYAQPIAWWIQQVRWPTQESIETSRQGHSEHQTTWLEAVIDFEATTGVVLNGLGGGKTDWAQRASILASVTRAIARTNCLLRNGIPIKISTLAPPTANASTLNGFGLASVPGFHGRLRWTDARTPHATAINAVQAAYSNGTNLSGCIHRPSGWNINFVGYSARFEWQSKQVIQLDAAIALARQKARAGRTGHSSEAGTRRVVLKQKPHASTKPPTENRPDDINESGSALSQTNGTNRNPNGVDVVAKRKWTMVNKPACRLGQRACARVREGHNARAASQELKGEHEGNDVDSGETPVKEACAAKSAKTEAVFDIPLDAQSGEYFESSLENHEKLTLRKAAGSGPARYKILDTLGRCITEVSGKTASAIAAFKQARPRATLTTSIAKVDTSGSKMNARVLITDEAAGAQPIADLLAIIANGRAEQYREGPRQRQAATPRRKKRGTDNNHSVGRQHGSMKKTKKSKGDDLETHNDSSLTTGNDDWMRPKVTIIDDDNCCSGTDALDNTHEPPLPDPGRKGPKPRFDEDSWWDSANTRSTNTPRGLQRTSGFAANASTPISIDASTAHTFVSSNGDDVDADGNRLRTDRYRTVVGNLGTQYSEPTNANTTHTFGEKLDDKAASANAAAERAIELPSGSCDPPKYYRASEERPVYRLTYSNNRRESYSSRGAGATGDTVTTLPVIDLTMPKRRRLTSKQRDSSGVFSSNRQN